MNIQDLIGQLSNIKDVHGNLPLLGGTLAEDTENITCSVVGLKDGIDIRHGGKAPYSVFLEGN